MGAANCGSPAPFANIGAAPTRAPDLARICASAPVSEASSSAGLRSAPDQLLCRSQPAAAAEAMALVRSVRCIETRPDKSLAAKTTVSPARMPIAARATPRKLEPSRMPSVSLGLVRGPSVIAAQAKSVPSAQHRRDDLRITRILLDLAAQVLHVRVDDALVALELIAADPVDELKPRIHPARRGREREQDAPFCWR